MSAAASSTVYLNMYRDADVDEFLKPLKEFGQRHTAIEHNGQEYYFGNGAMSRPGDRSDWNRWTFYKRVELTTPPGFTTQQFIDAFESMKASVDWQKYDLFSCNCNHFTVALSRRLCLGGYPRWVRGWTKIGKLVGYATKPAIKVLKPLVRHPAQALMK